MRGSDYIDQIREHVHDLAEVDWTDAELLKIVNTARQRVSLDLHCVRSFVPGLNAITGRETYPIKGGVGGLTLTAAGSGYTSAPTVTIAPPVAAGGVAATAVATVSGGVVTSLLMTSWGSGYDETPAVAFSGGGGAGAAATALPLNKVLDILSITAIWPGNTNSFTLGWRVFSWFQAFCRSYRSWQGYPRLWTNHTEGNLFFLFPVPDQVYGLELDVIALSTDLPTMADEDRQILQPNADCVQYFGAFLALAKLQNFDQAEYWKGNYKERVREVTATKQSRRIPNPYAALLGRA